MESNDRHDMNELIQSYRIDEVKLAEILMPKVVSGMVLVITNASLISIGTDKKMASLP